MPRVLSDATVSSSPDTHLTLATTPIPGAGRTVTRVSPTEPGPGDTPAVVPVDSPVPYPCDRRHDIEPVRPPVVTWPVTPRPSGVLHLDPEAILADLGAQGERAAVPGG